jgi:hypothetical protein
MHDPRVTITSQINFKIDHRNQRHLAREIHGSTATPSQISHFGFPLSCCYMYIYYFVVYLTGDFNNRSLELLESIVMISSSFSFFENELFFAHNLSNSNYDV